MYKLEVAVAALLATCVSAPCTGSPCDGVDRGLTTAEKTAWALPVARQLRASKAEVLQAFTLAGWKIIYVDPSGSGGAFLFYKNDPLTGPYITLWAGAATADEEKDIERWTLKNIPGIPSQLASCFAFHVTQDRDK